jgi:hypothetical protein
MVHRFRAIMSQTCRRASISRSGGSVRTTSAFMATLKDQYPPTEGQRNSEAAAALKALNTFARWAPSRVPANPSNLRITSAIT